MSLRSKKENVVPQLRKKNVGNTRKKVLSSLPKGQTTIDSILKENRPLRIYKAKNESKSDENKLISSFTVGNSDSDNSLPTKVKRTVLQPRDINSGSDSSVSPKSSITTSVIKSPDPPKKITRKRRAATALDEPKQDCSKIVVTQSTVTKNAQGKQKNTKPIRVAKPKKNLKRRSIRVKESKVPPDIFGFDSSGEFDSDTEPYETELTKFDESRPYRLAFYVRPSNRLRINPAMVSKLNPTLNKANSTINSTVNMSTRLDSFCVANKSGWKMPMCSTPIGKKKAPLIQQKITSALTQSNKKKVSKENVASIGMESAIFEEPEPVPSLPPKPKTKIKESTATSSTVEPHFNKPTRRSYIKKTTAPAFEEAEEPSSDELQKTVAEKSVVKKTKTKKAIKDEEEFEKWSQSVNSEFNEVEKFDLSFG